MTGADTQPFARVSGGGEAAVAFEMARAFCEKFGGDSPSPPPSSRCDAEYPGRANPRLYRPANP